MTGEEFRSIRLSLGLKGYQMADALGIAPATVSRYEKERMPIPRVVEYAAKYLVNGKAAAPVPAERLVSALKDALREEEAI